MRSQVAQVLRYIAKRQVSRADGIIIGTLQVALSFGDIKSKNQTIKNQGQIISALAKSSLVTIYSGEAFSPLFF